MTHGWWTSEHAVVYYCLHFQELPWRAAQPATDQLYSAYVTCASSNQAVSSCLSQSRIRKMLEPDPANR